MTRRRLATTFVSGLMVWGLLAVGAPMSASAEEVEAVPSPQVTIGIGMAGWRAESCRCVDRMGWDTEIGGGLSWHHLIGVEGGAALGGMLFPKSGHIPYIGWFVGYRGHLIPPPREWWEDFYLRTGYTRRSITYTRMDHIEGAYIRGGWSLNIWGPFYADGELGFAYFPGVMEHTEFGMRGLVRMAF